MDGGLARSLDRHNLLLLSCEELVDLLDEAVVELLYFAFSVLSDILWSVVCLDTLLDGIVGIAARIAHTYLGILCIGLDLLDEFATAIFGEWGDTEADQLTIVLWVMPRGELMIARSMSRMIPFSQGVMTMLLASGTVTVPT